MRCIYVSTHLPIYSFAQFHVAEISKIKNRNYNNSHLLFVCNNMKFCVDNLWIYLKIKCEISFLRQKWQNNSTDLNFEVINDRQICYKQNQHRSKSVSSWQENNDYTNNRKKHSILYMKLWKVTRRISPGVKWYDHWEGSRMQRHVCATLLFYT